MAIDYIKLENDLRAACEAARAADPMDDNGGSCNLDSIFLKLKYADEAKVEAAAKAAGGWARKDTWFKSVGFFIHVPTEGQAHRRETMVEAGYKKLRELGYNVYHYQQMD